MIINPEIEFVTKLFNYPSFCKKRKFVVIFETCLDLLEKVVICDI